MAEIIQSTDLRRRVREVLDRVRLRGESVIVKSYDTPQAVLIPYEEYESYLAWRSERLKRQAWLSELRAIAEEVSTRAAITEDEVTALVKEARNA